MSWKARYWQLLNEEKFTEEFEPVLGQGDQAFYSKPHAHGVSSIAMRESGAIETFAAPALGMRIDPGLGAITLQAPRINMIAEQIDFFCPPFKLRWNTIPMHLSPTLHGFTATGEPVTVMPGTLDAASSIAQKGLEPLGELAFAWLAQL